MRLRRLGLLCVASVVMATLLPANAFAAFRLRVEDGAGSGFVMTDQAFDGAHGDLEKSLGRILAGDHELSPGITIGYTAAETTPAVPSGASSIYSQLFLSSIVVTATRAATVSLFFEETSYMNGAGNTRLLTDTTTGRFVSGGAGTTVTSQSWARADDQVPGYGPDQYVSTALPAIVEPLPPAGTTPTPLQTFVSSGKDSEIFGGESYTWFSDVGPTPGYSLSSATKIDFLGAEQVDFKRNTFIAPEPSALALFGAGLLGIVHIARRRRRGLTRNDV